MTTAGAWLIHPVLIIAGKIVIDTIPGMTQELSWTLVNLIYLGVSAHITSPIHNTAHGCPQLSYLMFHWVTGIPFQSDLHGGAYDDLTMWEQIDEGAHYTPAKKWLFSVPVALCVTGLLSPDLYLILPQVPCVNTLHALQSMALCHKSHCTDIRPHPQASSGKARRLTAMASLLSPLKVHMLTDFGSFIANVSGSWSTTNPRASQPRCRPTFPAQAPQPPLFWTTAYRR